MIVRRASQHLCHMPQYREARHDILVASTLASARFLCNPRGAGLCGRSALLRRLEQGAAHLSQVCSGLVYAAAPRVIIPQNHRRDAEDLFSVSLVLRPKDSIARIAQSRDDVGVFIQVRIECGGVEANIGMGIERDFYAFGRSDQR
jgi:hypothetical protein